jgi:hypothetical protein
LTKSLFSFFKENFVVVATEYRQHPVGKILCIPGSAWQIPAFNPSVLLNEKEK